MRACTNIQTDHLKWISKTLLAALAMVPPRLSVDHRIYITGRKALDPKIKILDYDGGSPTSSSLPEEECLDEKVMLESHIFRAVNTRKGRPDVYRLLESAITHATGPVSVDGNRHSITCLQKYINEFLFI